MAITNSEIRKQARNALDENWGNSAVLILVFYLITLFLPILGTIGGFNTAFLSLLSWLCLPMGWGVAVYFLSIIRREKADMSMLFIGYEDFLRIFFTILLQSLYILLWSLLLIVPGIIKSFSYAMTPYILRDNPDMKYDAAITESMRLMDGHKMKLFLLCLSFIGWGILCLLTFGLGFLLLVPYMQASIAAFYEDLITEEKVSSTAYTI